MQEQDRKMVRVGTLQRRDQAFDIVDTRSEGDYASDRLSIDGIPDEVFSEDAETSSLELIDTSTPEGQARQAEVTKTRGILLLVAALYGKCREPRRTLISSDKAKTAALRTIPFKQTNCGDHLCCSGRCFTFWFDCEQVQILGASR